MTRLQSDDIKDIASNLDQYDANLHQSAGLTLKGLGCLAAGTNEAVLNSIIDTKKVICVPITCGNGKIEGFTETLIRIAEHLGFQASVTGKSDIAGFYEAYQNRADIILAADDNHFISINTKTQKVVENNDATGKGFACGLDRLVGGLKNKKILVIGCGPVGKSACLTLIRLKAIVSIADTNMQRCHAFAAKVASYNKYTLEIEHDLHAALRTHQYIIDASPAPDIIEESIITQHTYVSAPGMPCGVSSGARHMLSDRFIHDPLQIGVATMLMETIG